VSPLLWCLVVQFNKENGYEIQEVKLRVVLVAPPSRRSPVAESAEEGVVYPNPYPVSAAAGRGLTPTDPVSPSARPCHVCSPRAIPPYSMCCLPWLFRTPRRCLCICIPYMVLSSFFPSLLLGCPRIPLQAESEGCFRVEG